MAKLDKAFKKRIDESFDDLSEKRAQKIADDAKKAALSSMDPIGTYFEKMKNYSPKRAELIKKNLNFLGASKDDLSLVFGMSDAERKDFFDKDSKKMKEQLEALRERRVDRSRDIEVEKITRTKNVDELLKIVDSEKSRKDIQNVLDGKSSPDVLPPELRGQVLNFMSTKEAEPVSKIEKDEEVIDIGDMDLNQEDLEVLPDDAIKMIKDAPEDMDFDESTVEDLVSFYDKEELKIDKGIEEMKQKIEDAKSLMDESRRIYVDLDYDLDKHSSFFRKVFGLGQRPDMGQSAEAFEDAKNKYQENVKKYVDAMIEAGFLREGDPEIGRIILQERMNYQIDRSEVRMEKSPNLSKFENFWNSRFDEYRKMSFAKKAAFSALLVGGSIAVGATGGTFAAGAAGALVMAKRFFSSAALASGVKVGLDAKLEREDEKYVTEGAEEFAEIFQSAESKRGAMMAFFEDEINSLDSVIQNMKLEKTYNTWKGIGAGGALMAVGPAMGKVFDWVSELEVPQELKIIFGKMFESVSEDFELLSSEARTIAEDLQRVTEGAKVFAREHELVTPSVMEGVPQDTSIIEGSFDEKSEPSPIVISDKLESSSEDFENRSVPITEGASKNVVESEIASDMKKPDFGVRNSMAVVHELGISPKDYSEMNDMTISELLSKYPEMGSERESFDFSNPSEFVRGVSDEQKLADFLRSSMEQGKEFGGSSTVGEALRQYNVDDFFGRGIDLNMTEINDEYFEFYKSELAEFRQALFRGNMEDWNLISNRLMSGIGFGNYDEVCEGISDAFGLKPVENETVKEWTARVLREAIKQNREADLEAYVSAG